MYICPGLIYAIVLVFDICSFFLQIHNVSRHVSFEVTSSSWALVLDCYGKLVEIFSGKACTKRFFLGNVNVVRTLEQFLETLRFVLLSSSLVSLIAYVTHHCHSSGILCKFSPILLVEIQRNNIQI